MSALAFAIFVLFVLFVSIFVLFASSFPTPSCPSPSLCPRFDLPQARAPEGLWFGYSFLSHRSGHWGLGNGSRKKEHGRGTRVTGTGKRLGHEISNLFNSSLPLSIR